MRVPPGLVVPLDMRRDETRNGRIALHGPRCRGTGQTPGGRLNVSSKYSKQQNREAYGRRAVGGCA